MVLPGRRVPPGSQTEVETPMPANAQSDLERWREAALNVESDDFPKSNVPVHVFFGEAVDVHKFFLKYWQPEMDGKRVVRRGLLSAAGDKSRVHGKLGEEILSLQRATQDAHTRYLLTVDPTAGGDPVGRGGFLLDELTATLEFYFDDGVEDENDLKLANLNAAHADDPSTADAIAGALEDYAALADPHRAALDGLGGFEAAFIDEARALAATLRERPATPLVMSEASKRAIALRNKLATLLWERMNIVRGAARFVFRDQPEIVRQATSAYERRRRAEARRRAEKKAEAEKKAAAEKKPEAEKKPA